MDISIGKFRIISDPKNYTVSKTKKASATDKLPERTIDVFCGHYSTFESALKSIPSHALRRSDAANLYEAIGVIERYHNLITGALRGA